MTDEEIKTIIKQAAEESATRTAEKLRMTGKIYRRSFPKSFDKTEELLIKFPQMKEDDPDRQRVEKALKSIEHFDYCDIIASKYFDGLTLEEIADIYDCAYPTIFNYRNRLIFILARQLFPDLVIEELQKM